MRAREQQGQGRAWGRGCLVRQASAGSQRCPCRLHPANTATVGWDWVLLKYVMEDQVLGAASCHIGQGSARARCLRLSLAPGPRLALLHCTRGRPNVQVECSC